MTAPMPAELHGRDRELAQLRALLAGAETGRGGLVLCIGEAGIGKTRLAQELATGAGDVTVVWGRCEDPAGGVPPLRPWRQVLRSIGAGELPRSDTPSAPHDRFRVVDAVADAVLDAARRAPLLVVLDDVHWADEASVLVLRRVADEAVAAPLLLLATLRAVEAGAPAGLADLHRAAGTAELHLTGLGPDDVGRQLVALGAAADRPQVQVVLDATGGNPFFVREVARAIVDGTWEPGSAPPTVRDVVAARAARLPAETRELLAAGAVLGRSFPLDLVADVLGRPVRRCSGPADAAVASGLLARSGAGELRFAHALTRDAVLAVADTATRAGLHRAAATALESRGDPDDERIAAIAAHRLALAPYGGAAAARDWALRAAAAAVRGLAFDDAVRWYVAALALDAPWPDAESRSRARLAHGRACYLAGDLDAAIATTSVAADAARAAGRRDLMAEAALVVEPASDPAVNAAITAWCGEALAGAADDLPAAVRARLLAQRGQLAFYAGDHELTRSAGLAALELARSADDDAALVAALRARLEACPGPDGRPERLRLSAEMLASADRTGDARTAMWGRLWRIDALVEEGALVAAADELAPLGVAVRRVGGPVGAWHLDRVTATVEQAHGRFAAAAEASARAYARMRHVEPSAATGAFLGIQWALARHFGTSDDGLRMARTWVEPPPRFRTMGRITRAYLLLRGGLPDEAAVQFGRAGPPQAWSWPVFFVAPGNALTALVAAGLGRTAELDVALAALEAFRGTHIVGGGVCYFGPVELTLGIGALTRGRLDDAVRDLDVAAEAADRAGALAFAADAAHHLALALAARARPGDRDRARLLAHRAADLASGLGMAPFPGPDLLRRLGAPDGGLTAREAEVARLVAGGLSNRGIAERLVISERTAGNHVQRILTKLGFSSRSQIAAWMSSGMSDSTPVAARPAP